MLTSHDAATYGAFMMEGLQDLDYEAVIQHWGQGCLEMVMEMTQHVPYLMELVNAQLALGREFPGVLDYEVCAPFGSWFGNQVLEDCGRGQMPASAQCRAKLEELVSTFFSQGEEGPVYDESSNTWTG